MQHDPTPTRPSRVFFRPPLQKCLQTIKHACYSTHARYDMAGRILLWVVPLRLTLAGAEGLFKETKMEAKILRIELELARKFRGMFLIADQHSAERAERILQSIRRQAQALAAQEVEPA
jgi:hypothetical protein